MSERDAIGALIKHELEHQGPCRLETLPSKFPTCSWNQVFMTVDALSREGTITIHPQARFQYLVSLAPSQTQVLQADFIRGAAGALQREANT
ncbi:MAG: uncharacterized protein K0S58_81 [Nitrospira sp.]|nr:uncharacterized protein [Nitrospira sp.]